MALFTQHAVVLGPDDVKELLSKLDKLAQGQGNPGDAYRNLYNSGLLPWHESLKKFLHDQERWEKLLEMAEQGVGRYNREE